MGCFFSSLNRIDVEYQFTFSDVLYLTQSWNILKTCDLQKFAQTVLIKTINQNAQFRQFWISKIQVDGNNYDFSQSESCLRTDLSWHIGLRDHSKLFISIVDQLLAAVHNENRLKAQIRSLNIPEQLLLIEYQTLLIMKQIIMENLRERFQISNYPFTDGYEQAWNKFLTYVIEHLNRQENAIRGPTQIIISAATNVE